MSVVVLLLFGVGFRSYVLFNIFDFDMSGSSYTSIIYICLASPSRVFPWSTLWFSSLRIRQVAKVVSSMDIVCEAPKIRLNVGLSSSHIKCFPEVAVCQM